MKQAYKILFVLSSALLLFNNCQNSDSQQPGIPDLNRFELEDLVTNLNEPMELDFLDENQVIFIERRGLVKVYDLREKVSKVVGFIPISYVYESGLLGIAVDPEYRSNNWVYFFHTPDYRPDHFVLSRFEVRNDSLINSTKIDILEFYYDYKQCCHNGGGLKFGPDGLLYISTGDNTGGTNYGPIDERPGQHFNDAQRTSANTMDFRGKILRIKPEADGSYSIPEGNLFEPSNPNALPEIFVMGVRNPWKINVDRKTGWLHWGEVGPNPGRHESGRGPNAHDEFNLAKKAGNFGWPYFVGDNKAYKDFDYETEELGKYFDADNVINDSPNNTGLTQLPPAQKALIWYPNTRIDTFSLLGTGGGSAVGGPMYHSEYHSNEKGAFPTYYDNYWFITDWMRGWIYAAKLNTRGDYVNMEPFLNGDPFKKPIDLEFGPDGKMYVLDYGSNWYIHNKDARLTQISYNEENRSPQAVIIPSQTSGAIPLEVKFTADQSYDLDEGDILSYEWIVDGNKAGTNRKQLLKTFDTPGNHQIQLVVTDAFRATDTTALILNLGNESPQMEIILEGNQSFYSPNLPIDYTIELKDNEDGQLGAGIKSSQPEVDIRTMEASVNLSLVRSTSAIDEPTFEYLEGQEIVEGSDCYSCHSMQSESVGPSFLQIAERFEDSDKWKQYLGQKIISGGFGSWGSKAMTAHPQHTEAESEAMVDYILALDDNRYFSNHKVSGRFQTNDRNNLVLISAKYQDRGALNALPIVVEEKRIVRPYRIHATTFELADRVVAKQFGEEGGRYAEIMLNGSYIGFKEVDLSNISKIKITLRSRSDWLVIDIRQNSPEDIIIGSRRIEKGESEFPEEKASGDQSFDVVVPITPSLGLKDLYITSNSNLTEGDLIYFDICQMEWIEFLQ